MRSSRLYTSFFSSLVSVLYIISLVICKTWTAETCPSPCRCQEEPLGALGKVYSVICTGEELSEMPDLTPLLQVSPPVHISLDSNELPAVYIQDFHVGLNIVSLDLSQNRDLVIEEDAFNNLATTLKKLMLDAIGLKFDKTLKMLGNLEVLEDLSVSHNNRRGYVQDAVENVTVPLFVGPFTKSLKILSMSHCGIKSLSENSLGSLEALEELDLSNNWFTKVPIGVRKLKNLKTLSFFRGNIDSLEDDTFVGMPNLEALVMNTNTLQTIAPKAFRGLEKSLKKLRLERCRLREIPSQALKDLTALEFLDLSQNSFVSAPSSSFVGKYCLKELLISAVGLQFERDTFSGQRNCITDLTIKQMQLKEVPREALAQLVKLARLSLDYNEIRVLPKDAFKGIKATSISLANNPLTKIEPGAFSGLPRDLDINLRRTHITDIDFLLHYPEDAIETVNLDYAKLECRCSMKSSLNATHNVQIYGSCTKGEYVLPLSSSRLEGILETACAEERAKNAGSFSRLDLSVGFFVVIVNAYVVTNVVLSTA